MSLATIIVPTASLNYLHQVITQEILQQEILLYRAGLKQKWKQKKYEERIEYLKVIQASIIDQLKLEDNGKPHE